MSGIDLDQAKSPSDFAARIRQGLGALAAVPEVSVGGTPRQAIYREDKLVLYRYQCPTAPKLAVRTPLLICYALVNRPYMMDLQPDRSLLRGLLEHGVDVYLIDWGYPDGADRYLEMRDYVERYLHRCVDVVGRTAATERINLLGVCQGGTLSLCYAALHPERLRNLITMVTPVDFRTPDNLLSKWAEHMDVDLLVDTAGNVPGEWLNQIFLALMPFRLTQQKYIDVLDELDKPQVIENFLRMEKWIFDSPDQAGEMFRQFVRWFFQENRLVNGGLHIGGREISLKELRLPVLNVYANRDHLVPPSSSLALKNLVGSDDYEAFAFNGGHIGIYVSGAAQRQVPPKIAEWLRARDT